MPGRVLRIVTRLNQGGPTRQLEALLPALARRGFSGPVLHGGVEPGEADAADRLASRGAPLGAPLVRVGTLRRGLHPLRDARALSEVLSLAREARPDLVHTHLGKAGALGRWVAHRLGVPAIHTFHGHHFDVGGVRGRWVRRAERALSRWTARAVALSERQRRDLVEVHRVLPAARVAVVPPGLDLARVRAQARSEASPIPPEPFWLWCGRFVAVKRPLLALEVAERLGPGARLVLLGEGPLRRRVLRAIARRGLQARVRAPGAVENPVAWVARAQALFLTSASEGTPLAVLEAFAVGTPVVVPTVGGLPDLVDHGLSGLWVPPGDGAALAATLARLGADGALEARLRRGAAAAASTYDGDLLGARTAALYEEVLLARA